MKNLLTIFFLLLSPLTLVAQERDRDEHRERIKALKTAHITQGMNLTAKEAQEFWPIYNGFEQERRKLYRQEHADVENFECMDERSANAKLEEYVELEKQDFLLKRQYYQDLRKIFSAKRIMQLKQVEEEFNEKLMREYRARRKNN